MKENKKKKIALVLSCVGIFLLLIGVSYSLTKFIFTGHRENLIDFKGLSFSYEEQVQGLSLLNQEPMTDEEGLASGNDYTFKVSSKSSIERDIDYKVYLTLFENNTLNKEYISLNLTNETTNVSTGVIKASELELIKDDNYLVMNDKFSFDGVTTSLEYNYKLTIWINSDYNNNGNYKVENNEQTTTIGGETFNFKINVAVGDIDADVNFDDSTSNKPNAPELASNMIPVYFDYQDMKYKKADSKNQSETHKWYDYKGKMWANAVTVTDAKRTSYINSEPGTIINDGDINTTWVWIPRFDVELCSEVKNPTPETHPHCYTIDMNTIDMSDETREELIDDFYYSSLLSGKSVTREEIESQFEQILNSPNSLDVLEEYLELYLFKRANKYLTLSENDKNLIYNVVGNDTLGQEFIDHDFAFFVLIMALMNSTDDSIVLTSNLEIPLDDETFNYMCYMEGISCNYLIPSFNSLNNSENNNEMFEELFGITAEYGNIALEVASDNVFRKIFKNIFDPNYNGATEFTCLNMNGGSDVTSTYSTKETCEAANNFWIVNNPGAFDVKFVNKDTKAHDAFTFGDKDLAGIWVSQFEPSHLTLANSTNTNYLGCTSETCENAKEIVILPGMTPLTNNNVLNFFYAGRSLTQSGNLYGLSSSDIDSHTMKNNEWGAVVYLTQSVYGRCATKTLCTEVGINSESLTGYGAPANNPTDTSDSSYVTPAPFNPVQGMYASTTGNIYGIYDMNGLSAEYVAGVYWNGVNINTMGIDTKYFNLYTNSIVPAGNEILDLFTKPITDYSATMKHALTETAWWYNDMSGFVNANGEFFARGGTSTFGVGSGIYCSLGDSGLGAGGIGTRFVLVK